MDRHQITPDTTSKEILAAVTAWLAAQPPVLPPTQPLGRWLITEPGPRLSPIEILEEALYLALSGDSCEYDFDATQLALFRVPCHDEHGQEFDAIQWVVFLDARPHTLGVSAEYFDDDHGRNDGAIFKFTVDETALDTAFAAGPDAAIAALRDALVDLVIGIRDHLHQLPGVTSPHAAGASTRSSRSPRP
jgi:hypothetical protein